MGAILCGLSALLLPIIFKAPSRLHQDRSDIQREMEKAVEALDIAKARLDRTKHDLDELMGKVSVKTTERASVAP